MNTFLKRTELFLSGLSVLAIVAVMLIVSIDTGMRYVLHAPLPWSYELISFYLLIAGTHFAVSDTFREGDHIGVDLLPASVPAIVRRLLEMAWVTGAVLVFGIISYGAAESSYHAYLENEFIPGYIAWPVWLSYLPIAIGAAVMTLRLIQHLVAVTLHGHNPHVAAHGDVLE